jgi:hypothetical protein
MAEGVLYKCCQGRLFMRLRTSFNSLIIASLLCASAQADWVNALKPQGKPAGQVMVVNAGKSQGGIQLPDHPTPQETNAAAELQHWIKELTGASLPIKSGKASGSRIAVRTDGSLGDEGYGIAVSRDQIILSGGKTRGVLNAVYALLEEDLGCRFYANDSIRLPRTNTLVIAPVDRRYVPQLKIRDPFYACAFDPVWSLRNRANSPHAAVPEEQGGHMDYAVCPHRRANCAAEQLLQGTPGLFCAGGRRHAHHRPTLPHAPRGGEDRDCLRTPGAAGQSAYRDTKRVKERLPDKLPLSALQEAAR